MTTAKSMSRILAAPMMLLVSCGAPSREASSDDSGDEVLGRVDVVGIRGQSAWTMSFVRSDGTERACTAESCGNARSLFEAAPQLMAQCAVERDRSGIGAFFRHQATRTLCTRGPDFDAEGNAAAGAVANCSGCVPAPGEGDGLTGEELPSSLAPSLPVGRDEDFDGPYPSSDGGCYLAADATVRCFGHNGGGGLGVGRPNTLDDIGLASLHGCSSGQSVSTSSCTVRDFGDVVALPDKVLQLVDTGSRCALLVNGDVYCWGFLGGTAYELSHLGLESTYCETDIADECVFVGDDERPGDIVPLPIGFPVEELACSAAGNGCVVRNASGEVWRLGCSERNTFLELGPGHTGEELGCGTATPRTRIALSEPARALRIEYASRRGCALLESGAVECFGAALNDNSPNWDPLDSGLQDAATAVLPLPGPAKEFLEFAVLLEDGRLFVYWPFEGKPGPAWGWAELDPDAYEWPQVCEPGTGRECPCGPGAVMEGIEECRDDGTGYLGCACPDRLCNPGAEDWCECDGGYWGFRVCGVDGESYTECQCAEKVDCCTSSNSCGKAGNGSCDCDGAFAGGWDQADCEAIAGVTTGSCAGLTPPEGYVCVPGGSFRDDPAYGGMGEEHVIPTLYVQQREASYSDWEGSVGYPPGLGNETVFRGCATDAWLDHFLNQSGEVRPARCIPHGDAVGECMAEGGRLPTEWEWEWIARGRDEARKYPWGPTPPGDEACWRGSEGGLDEPCLLADVPASGATRDGVLGMAGGVAEWTSSKVMDSHAEGASDCYPGFDGVVGSDDQCYVVRGGSYHTTIAAQLQTQTRDVEAPNFGHLYIGYRCVREVP